MSPLHLNFYVTLSANSYKFLFTARFSAIYTTYCKQWQLSAPLYCSTLYKTVCSNNLLSEN